MSKTKSNSETPLKSPLKTVSVPLSTASKVNKDKPDFDFAFGKINYIYMLAGIVFIIVGFMLMAGGRSSDPSVFNPEIFSFRRITLAPIIVMIGFAIEIFAIVKKAED
jgi:hypothetical protein